MKRPNHDPRIEHEPHLTGHVPRPDNAEHSIYNEPALAAHGVPQPTIDHDLACAQCGYNLRGLKMGERCPECAAVSVGAAISCNELDRHSVYYERNIFPERQGAPQTCEREWSCSACGYNRRGLSITKPCPECGHIERDTLAPLDKPGFAPWLTMKIN